MVSHTIIRRCHRRCRAVLCARACACAENLEPRGARYDPNWTHFQNQDTTPTKKRQKKETRRTDTRTRVDGVSLSLSLSFLSLRMYSLPEPLFLLLPLARFLLLRNVGAMRRGKKKDELLGGVRRYFLTVATPPPRPQRTHANTRFVFVAPSIFSPSLAAPPITAITGTGTKRRRKATDTPTMEVRRVGQHPRPKT